MTAPERHDSPLWRGIRALDAGTRGLQHTFVRRRAERWSQQQVRFSEDAREAARKALWFLRLVEIDSDETLRRHAQENAAREMRAVRVPGAREWADLSKPATCGYSGAVEPSFHQLVLRWRAARMRLGGPTPALTATDLGLLERELEWFIAGSRPLDWWIRFTYVRLPALARAVRQHSALVATTAVVAGICLGVEAVRSLLLNDGSLTLWLAALVLSPVFVLHLDARWRHRRARTAPWRLGARVVRWRPWLPASVEPASWLQWHPDGYQVRVFNGLLRRLGAYVLLWTVYGLGIALVARTPRGDPVSLTIYLILALSGAVMLVGNALDFAEMHSEAPLRGLVLAGAAATGVAIVLTDSAWWIGGVTLAWLLGMLLWSSSVRIAWAFRWVPVTLAVVVLVGLVARARRPSFAAPATARALAPPIGPEAWPRGDAASGPVVVLAASGGGSRAAIFTAKALTALDSAYPEIAARLQAISSVSGGSLASAAYVARRLRRSGWADDSLVRPCEQPLAESMRTDFIAPVLVGLVRGGRGRAIERAWEECPVGLGRLSLDDLARAWRGHEGPGVPFPVPLFNSVSLERHAVVLTPFAQALTAAPFDEEARTDSLNAYRGHPDATWVHYRSGIYHFSDLLDTADAALTSAVRASANFPFGFPLVEIATRKPLWYSTSMAAATPGAGPSARIVRLTDGGALSNSGVWPLLPLLLNQRARIGDDRGVLLITVDASRMPGAPETDRQRGLLATILDKDPKGERVHLLTLQLLTAAYGDCFQYVHLGLEPSRKFNVYTTWALDGHSLELVDRAFDAAWAATGPRIAEAYGRAAGCRNAGGAGAAQLKAMLRVKGRVPID